MERETQMSADEDGRDDIEQLVLRGHQETLGRLRAEIARMRRTLELMQAQMQDFSETARRLSRADDF